MKHFSFFDFINKFNAENRSCCGAERLRKRTSRLEMLEDRMLLSVTTAEYADIRTSYAEFELPESMSDINIIEITADKLTSANIKAAIAEAGETAGNDLIVLRTTADFCSVDYASAADEIQVALDSSESGSLTMVAYGASPLTINAGRFSRVLSIGSESVLKLGNLTLTGGNSSKSAVSAGYGGGLYNAGKLTASQLAISDNLSSYSGGGLFNTGTIRFFNVQVTSNTASASYYANGGGIYSSGAITAENILIADNSSEGTMGRGGGVYLWYGQFNAVGATITGNSAVNGGGAYLFGSATSQYTFSLNNSVFAGNSASAVGNDLCRSNNEGTTAGRYLLTESNDWDASLSLFVYDSSKPLFTDAAAGNYSLPQDSQAVDIGNNDYVTVENDLAGNGRIYNSIVDLGAYEYHTGVLPYITDVTLSGWTGDYDGAAHSVTLTDPKAATDTIVYTYNGQEYSVAPSFTEVGSYTVSVKVSRAGYQSWTGSADVNILPVTSSIVVTTNLDVVDETDGLISLREAIALAESETAETNRITFASSVFTGGDANKILLSLGELTISKSLSISAASLSEDIVIDADGKNRVITVSCSDAADTVQLTDLVITGGKNSESTGAGLYVKGSGTVSLTRCLIIENGADSGSGGGLYLEAGTVSAVNTVIAANTAGIGAGIYAAGGTFNGINCTIAANSAANYGGGVANWGTVHLVNSIVSKNCGVLQNPDWFGLGTDTASSNNLIGFDAKFTVNPLFDEEGNLTNADSYDLTLSSLSWGIDRGLNGASEEAVDMAGYPRTVQAWETEAVVDLGAYEYQTSFARAVETPSLTVTTLLDIVDDTDGLISLREAILYAESGDTILFAEDLTGGTISISNSALILDKQMTIDASSLEEGITLDGNTKTTIMIISGGTESAPTVIKNLSFINGASYDGGGILNCGGWLSISDAVLSACDATYGSAIFNFKGNLTCSNLTFSKNTTAGALYSYYGTVTVMNCTFTENNGERGAAIYNSGGTVTVTGSSMTKNSARYGGGIQNVNGKIIISDTTIADNGSYYGGGICNYGEVVISNSVISGNNAYYNGGGIYDYLSTVTATNVLLYGNTAGYGGAVCVDEGTFNAINCTITANDSNYGGGIFAYGVASEDDDSKLYAVTLCNTIIAANTAVYGADVHRNNTDGTFKGAVCLSSFTEWDNAAAGGNLVYDSTKRLFCDLDNHDYQLASGAQAIDAGSNTFVKEISLDLAGNPRIVNEVVDMGCYEFQRKIETPSAVVTTDQDVVDDCDGLISLREAINYIESGSVTETVITFDAWLEGKTITLDSSLGALEISESITIDASELVGGVTVSGGKKVRVFEIADTITDEAPVSMISVVITGGSAEEGAGVLNMGALTMTNCLVYGNTAIANGGGIRNLGGDLKMNNSTVTANTAAAGAGVWSASMTLADPYSVDFQNSILAGNILAEGSEAENTDIGFSDELGALNAYNTLSSFTNWDNASDPEVVNYQYDSGLSLFADAAQGDYTLASDSQAIDKGNNTYIQIASDLNAEPRIVNGIVDLGAYEYLFNNDPGDILSLAETVSFTDSAYSCREMIGNGLNGDKDVDFYAVEITADDLTRIFSFSVSAPKSGELVDTIIRVFNAEGEELGNSGDTPVLSWTPSETGTFYFGISALANDSYNPLSVDERVSGETGDYLLSISYQDRIPMTEATLSETYLAVGAILTASFAPEDATTSWQWVRGTDPETMTAIDGAVSLYYEVSSDDVGYYIGVQITGYGYYVGTVSAVTETVVPEFEKNLVVDTLEDVVADDGKTSLREAIAYADTGDTITFDSSLNGGTILLNGYALTIGKLINIDASALEGGISVSASGQHRVLMVTAGELGSNVKLTNMTIRDGYAMYGGGIYNSGYLELVNSMVTNCSAYYGGGIYNLRSWNSTSSYSTGYVALTSSSVESCTAVYGGGGIWNQAGIIALKYAEVTDNEAPIGGGIYNYYGSCSTSEALIASNTATRYGGGICNDQGTFYFMGTTIAGNSAANAGGVYNYSTEGYEYEVEFYNSLIAGNTATKEGADILCDGSGKMYAYNAMSSFTEWTNTESQTYVSYVYDSSKPLYTNAGIGDFTLAKDSQAIDIGQNSYSMYSIDLAGNPRISNEVVDLGAYEYQFGTQKTELESVSITYSTEELEIGTVVTASVLPAEAETSGSVVWQWYRGVSSAEMTAISGAVAASYTVTDDDAGFYLQVSATGTGDYTGTVTATTEEIVPEPIDMTIVTTSEDVIDLTDELVSLREAILNAKDGTVITFDSSLQGETITLSADLGTLVISRSITLDASALCNPVTQAPRLTVNANAVSGESRRVFEITGAEDALIDVSIIGIKITGGRVETSAEGEENAEADGGGLYAKNVNLTLDRCYVTKNVARASVSAGNSFATGGGIYFSGGVLTIKNSSVYSNSLYAYSESGMAETLGGGIRADGTVTITKSTVSSHYASAGAGIYLESGSLTFTQGALSNNSAKIESDADDNVAAYGGGLYAVSGEVIFRSSEIKSNSVSAISVSGTANGYGGALYLDAATLLMEDVKITENSASAATGDSTAIALGGAIYSQASVTLINTMAVLNTVFASADSAEAAGGAVALIGSLTASEVTIADNSVLADSEGTPTAAGGGLYLYAGSAVLKNTIAVNNTAESGADVFRRASSTVNGFNTLSSYEDWDNAGETGVTNYLYDAALPLFLDEENADYTLDENSQAADRGNNDYARYADGTVISRDLAGEKRIVNQIVDLGAYEYQTGELIQLDTPEGLTVFSAGGQSIQVSWNSVANASGYEVAYTADGSSWQTKETSGTSVTVGSLPYRAIVAFKVRALGDGFDYTDSEFSASVDKLICPMDVNGDGDISNLDRAYLASAWLSEEGDENFIAAADINGDGEVTNLDRAYLSANWLKEADDPDLIYPAEESELIEELLDEVFNTQFESFADFNF